MGQPVLMATLAFTIALMLTAAIAIATVVAERLSRAMNLTVLAAFITVAAVAIQRAELRINFTGSMPIGIYLLSPLAADGLKRGMLVAACATTAASEIGRHRGYLTTGPCTGDSERLLRLGTIRASRGARPIVGSGPFRRLAPFRGPDLTNIALCDTGCNRQLCEGPPGCFHYKRLTNWRDADVAVR